MKISKIIKILEIEFPLSLQEHYDNSGLLVGAAENEVEAALITVDITEKIVDEAIAKKANLIIAHHPLIFGGIKRLNGYSWLEKTLIKAIKNDIAIYAIHTNLDNRVEGTNQFLAKALGLQNIKALRPLIGKLLKLVVFCPVSHADAVRHAIFEAGAGVIGNYSNCSFNSNGIGTFKANNLSNPFVGQIGKDHHEEEARIETIFPDFKKTEIIQSMKNAHPYEEVAFDLYPLANQYDQLGSGIIGTLDQADDSLSFLQKIKTITKAGCIKHTDIVKDKVKKVAICGGSGGFLIADAKAQGADVFITGDVKYHEFFDADSNLIIADVGHYETEQFTKEILCELLKKKFPTFAFLKSDISTNPINYL